MLGLDSGMEHEADRSELPSFFVPTVTTKASLCVCVYSSIFPSSSSPVT